MNNISYHTPITDIQSGPDNKPDDITLDHFYTMFCKHRVRDKYIIRRNDQWKQLKRVWKKDLVVNHLKGNILLGLLPSESIDYLMIDIDNHEGDSLSLQTRFRSCIRTFDCEAVVYQSSDSGGIRVLYALDREYPKKTVYHFAKKQLQEHGCAIGAGQIEIMATQKGDRLPFGKGSYLVDQYDLTPLHELCQIDSIQRAWDIWCTHKLAIRDDQLSSATEISEHASFQEVVNSLLTNGLQPGITTNDALMKLAWYFRNSRKLSADETRKCLQDWIANKHNGLSNRINRGKQKSVFEQIERILKSLKPRTEQTKSKWLPCPLSLTLIDVQRIISRFDNYEDQMSAYSLLKYVKNHGSPVINTGEVNLHIQPNNHISNSIVAERGIEDKDEGYEGTKYRAGTHPSWKCEIPHKAFRRFEGFVKECPYKTKLRMQKCKLLKQIEPENRKNHKCRTYAIFFEFDDSSEEVTSLDNGLSKIRSICQ